ncbi:MAG TPA: ABC transporter permease [Puia sp.]|nr:ABC transporter permease [Puia sp.]
MLKNYLKIAFRNLAKYKFISFINLFGLTVGLSCCLLILSYIIHETSYDRFNSKADRIYRVTRSFNDRNGIVSLHLSAVAPPFGPLLQNDFPDIEAMTRVLSNGTTPMRYEEKIFNEQNAYFADSNFTRIFDVAVTRGNPANALADPFSVMITEEEAKKYFNGDDPMNKVIRMNDQYNFKVTGIFRPFPSNAHFHPTMLLSFSTLRDSAIYGEKNLMTNFGNNAFDTYLLLPAHYPVRSMEAQFPNFLDKVMAQPRANANAGAAANLKPHDFTKLFLQPLTDIHLRSHLDDELEENGDSKRIWIFSAIALFILLIACINYMNLSTARSALRAKEIGIRKVAGAQRQEIIMQFLSESVLMAYMALIFAGLLVWAVMPWVNAATGLELSITSLIRPQVMVPLLLTPLAVGLLSGVYPALFMSSFQPSKVLKGLFKAGGGTISFRKVLVVAQFAISIILIVSTVIVFQQLHYMQTSSLGFSKEHILTMDYNSGLDRRFTAFREQLLRNQNIKNAARSSRIPSGRLLDSQGAQTESGDSLQPVTATIKYLAVDYDFNDTYGIPLAAGRDFSRTYGTDTAGFVLNAAATSVLGLRSPEEAVGKKFQYGNVKGRIIGIVKDFHFESMHQKIIPLIMVLPPEAPGGPFNKISIKIGGNNIPGTLAQIERTWKQYLPTTPFEYTFLDERFNRLYQSEERQGSLFTSFSGIAVFIACLGLLGLSAFSISQRIKEIGVRKVLGASTGSLVRLLSVEFLKLVAIAALFAIPVAWYVMFKWLGDFAYRISILGQWWVFLAAAILAATVALVTISWQAIRAAMANPVKSLRSE